MNYKNYSIKNFDDATTYLDSFVNYERKVDFPYAKTLKLGRVIRLFETLKIDFNKLKSIHIAGTKGKGSTATFCAYLLASGGYKVGLYTSPHFFDFRERIRILKETRNQSTETRINSNLIPKDDVASILREMQPQLEKLRFSEKLGKLSFFEVYTALAFKYFLKENLDFVVLETGLGGRLDATNVVNPLVSIITHIGYDHTDKLGNTLREIAGEKAGIIKPRTDVISAAQGRLVLRVFSKNCRKLKSKLFVFGRDFKVVRSNLCEDSSNFDFSFGGNELKELKVFLKGRCQLENVSLAIAAMLLLKEKGVLSQNINFKEAICNSFIEGRFETLKSNPLIVCDVAHNPSSFRALRDNLKIYYPSKKIILIFAASGDKDVRNMLKEIKFEHIVLTRFNNPRARNPLEIQRICKLKKAFIAKDISMAMEKAKNLYDSNSLILISGSLFLVGEAKGLLQHNKITKLQDIRQIL
ncbi:MAG: folylpolyglutamate synthase/dihydrofolate synthase family protein [Candidatus Omnitrophota bacterium]|jgi:dihydrofolate synthase/folylpolyglutamate synthase